MKLLFKRNKKDILEADDTEQTTQPTDTQQQTQEQQPTQDIEQNTDPAQDPAVQKLIDEGKNLHDKISKKRIEYLTATDSDRKRLIEVNKRLNTIPGIQSFDIPESIQTNINYSRKLFEARSNDSEVDELRELLLTAIERVDGISYVPVKSKALQTYARNLKTFITNSKWRISIKNENHWDELNNFLYAKFTSPAGKFKYTEREAKSVLENFKKLLMENTTFMWIFGDNASTNN